MELPPELKDMYALYQQEIHASTYTSGSGSGATPSTAASYDRKLPPIYKRHTPPSSSSGSDWSPSPHSANRPSDPAADGPDGFMGPPVGPKLPLISARTRTLR